MFTFYKLSNPWSKSSVGCPTYVTNNELIKTKAQLAEVGGRLLDLENHKFNTKNHVCHMQCSHAHVYKGVRTPTWQEGQDF